MNVHEKQAWFVLAVFGVTIFLYGMLTAIIGFHPANSFVLFLMFLCFFVPLIGRSEKKQGKAITDERDREILKKACWAGFGVLWFVFLSCMMLLLAILGPDAIINVKGWAIMLLVGAAGGIVGLTQAITTIILYRRG